MGERELGKRTYDEAREDSEDRGAAPELVATRRAPAS